jgi:hypothetical protein
MPAGFESRLLRKADWGREDDRQTGLPGLRYAVPRRQRVMPGLCAAGSSQIRHVFRRSCFERARASF